MANSKNFSVSFQIKLLKQTAEKGKQEIKRILHTHKEKLEEIKQVNEVVVVCFLIQICESSSNFVAPNFNHRTTVRFASNRDWSIVVLVGIFE